MRHRLFGDSHLEIASSLVNVAILQVATHQYTDAVQSAQMAEAIFTKSLSATHWKTAFARSVEGTAHTGLGEYQAAEQQLLPAYKLINNDAGALPMYRALARHYLETLYQRWGRPEDARRYADAKARLAKEPLAAVPATPN